jgi:hypothetical protein
VHTVVLPHVRGRLQRASAFAHLLVDLRCDDDRDVTTELGDELVLARRCGLRVHDDDVRTNGGMGLDLDTRGRLEAPTESAGEHGILGHDLHGPWSYV